MHITVSFITLGCPKNEVDTNKMKAKLLSGGYTCIEETNQADLVIVNTCSFLTSAVEESLDTIFELIEDKVNPHQKILVAGCMPSRYGDSLYEELPEVSAFVTTKDEENIIKVVNDIFEIDDSPSQGGLVRFDDGLPYAYVKISDGCDRFCSYCMIPYIRGRYHSFSQEDILAEVEELVIAGIQEIVFIGQDTGLWGQDFAEQKSIVDLLKVASQQFPSTWFRLLYIQPEGITDELLSLMNNCNNICSYLDIPLQHVNSEVLSAMNRKGCIEEYLKLITHIRETVPDISIRTTFMAGFPGETDAQCEELLSFIEKSPFDYAGVFAFSPEEGTKAEQMPEQIEEEIRIERAQAVQDTCEATGFALNALQVGKTFDVIIEGTEQTELGFELLARCQRQAPEIDGQIHIPVKNVHDYRVGQHIMVKIVDAFCYELIGDICNV